MSGDLVITRHPELAKIDWDIGQTSESLYLLLRDGHVHQFNLVRKGFVDLHGKDLQRKNLQNINFSKANLCRINLRNASLAGADFSNANLQGAKLEGTELGESYIQKVKWRSTKRGQENLVEVDNPPNKTIDVNGYKIRYLEFDDVNSEVEKNGKIVILLHGMAGSAEVWLLVAYALSKFFRVLVPDIMGFGYSDKPTVEYNLDFFMKFLSEFMQIMQIGKASIVSHSFGARLALEFAIRFDSRVDKQDIFRFDQTTKSTILFRISSIATPKVSVIGRKSIKNLHSYLDIMGRQGQNGTSTIRRSI